jgi:hypothetical protein
MEDQEAGKACQSSLICHRSTTPSAYVNALLVQLQRFIRKESLVASMSPLTDHTFMPAITDVLSTASPTDYCRGKTAAERQREREARICTPQGKDWHFTTMWS